MRILQNVIQRYKASRTGPSDPPHNMNYRLGRCGVNNSKLTQEKCQAMRSIAQEYLNDHIHCTDRLLREGMEEAGFKHPLSVIQHWKKQMGCETHTTHIKPTLMPQQKEARIAFIERQKEDDGLHFKSPHNTVHLDEVWYYLDRDSSKELRFPGQVAVSPRRTHSKSHITKVMALVALGYPHQRPDGTFFDGKIGIWFCVESVPAQRSSVNRSAGTPVTTPYVMTADRYVDFYTRVGGVRDRIRQQLHHLKEHDIQLQHYGARPHTGQGAVQRINDYLQQDNWRATLVTQPPQIPDLNVLDLGLFNGLKRKADRVKGAGKNIDTCIERMRQAYQDYDSNAIGSVYGVLYEVYRLIVFCNGDNTYKLPHAGVRTRRAVNGQWVNRNV